jgi:hypothetical protein
VSLAGQWQASKDDMDGRFQAFDGRSHKSCEGRQRVESVSSLMQEPAVSLLDAATVGNPPHC